jgi:hypothetical protein
MIAEVIGRRGAHDLEIADRPGAEGMAFRLEALAAC